MGYKYELPAAVQLALPHITPGGPSLILSVDDEPAVLFTRHKLLQSAGYDVLSAAAGEQALHFLESYPVDLVLLDYLMPAMDGGIIAQEINRSKPSLPVIMVSGVPVPDSVLVWVDCVVTKGNRPVLLLKKIEQLLSSRPRRKLQQESATVETQAGRKRGNNVRRGNGPMTA